MILRADLEELADHRTVAHARGSGERPQAGRARRPDRLRRRRRGPPKVLDGNQPRTVAQGTDGTIRLAASTAEIYGPNLTYETPLRNLGYWQSAEDHAAWTFTVDRPGTFTVAMEWACANESAGNPYLVRVNGLSIGGEVGGTGAGTWSNYRSIFLGEVVLPAGKHRLEFRPAGPVRNAFLDLRAVVLTPRGSTVFRGSK